MYCRACRCLLTSPVQYSINSLDSDLPSSELILRDAFVSLTGINTDLHQSVSHTAKQLPNFGVNESASTKYRVEHLIRFVEIKMTIKLRYRWNTSVTKVGISRFTRLVRYRRSRFYWWVGIRRIIPVHKEFPLTLISHGATHSPQAASCMVYPVWLGFIVFQDFFFCSTTIPRRLPNGN